MRFTTNPTIPTTTTAPTTTSKTTATRSRRATQLSRTLVAFAAAGALLLTACGGGKDTSTDTAAKSPPAAPAASAGEGDAVAVRKASTALGDILVGQDGLALYGFTNDTNGTSTCTGTCADAWPPVLVNADWQVGPGLDSGIFSTVRREDGSEQLMAGKWPLYYYSGDSVQGDLLGQGSGDVWFAVGLDATLIKDPAPAPGTGGTPAPAPAAASSVQVTASPLGEILTDGDGNTLYGFTNDADGVPTCSGDCAGTWPAHKIEGDPVIGPNLDPATFTLVDATDGGKQLKAGKWPLYRFSGDAKPGDVNGQGSGGVWFVVAADGKLIKDAPAPADSGGGDGGGSSSDGGDGGY
jgi:predicted lipoprotein with Yx(FWY)xxD motif